MSGSVSCFGARKSVSSHFGFELVERNTLVSIGWAGVLLCLVRSVVVEGEWTQYLIGVLTRTWSLMFV